MSRRLSILFLATTACGAGVVETKPTADSGRAGGSLAPDSDADPDSGPPGGDSGVVDDTGEVGPQLADAVTLEALTGHLDALQAIADTHADTRQTFGPGYADSVAYAVSVFEAAGYTVQQQTFTVAGFEEGDPPQLTQTDPSSAPFGGDQLRTLTYSAGGDVRAPLVAVDLVLPPGPDANSSDSGCQAADFDGFPVGAVALVQRGTCTFGEKVAFAEAAGASAVVLFNEGQSGRQSVDSWTLDPGAPPGIPALGTSFQVGDTLATALGAGAVEVHVVVDAGIEERPVTNVLAELEVGDPDRLVVVGAHLDSVAAGPGINDNGSGTAFVLAAAEAAVALELEPANRIRWALWGAEEIGLVGSDHYVGALSGAELDQHLANLNFDMIGSPNGGRFIYDGDGSATGYAGPGGSDRIEEMFETWFDGEGLGHAPTAFDGRSDYGPFIWAGIPAGGLFSGAESSMSRSEADLFGGVAGQPLDACYHQACDARANIDEGLLLEMARAAGHVTQAVAGWTAPLGPAGPERVPVRRVAPGELPLGHGHGHGCHPLDR